MNTLKKSLIIVFLITASLFVLSDTNKVYAQFGDCDLAGDTQLGVTVPKPSQLLCPFYRIINFFFIIVGIVFAVMLGVGAIKLATSLGDPKAFQGANRTWLYAVIGAFVAVGAYAVLRIVNNAFGLGLSLGTGPSSIYDSIQTQWENLIRNTFLIFE